MDQDEKKTILEIYGWIKVKKYEDNKNLSWEERYRALEKHHQAETNFLITKIRENSLKLEQLPSICRLFATLTSDDSQEFSYWLLSGRLNRRRSMAASSLAA